MAKSRMPSAPIAARSALRPADHEGNSETSAPRFILCACNGFRNGKSLLNDMPSARDRLPRIPQAGRRLARLRRAIHHARARPARQHRRPNRSLQIDGNLIARGADVVPDFRNLLQGRKRKKRLSPLLQIHRMNFIDQRSQRRPSTTPRRSGRTQQFGPALFDQPADRGLAGNASRRA